MRVEPSAASFGATPSAASAAAATVATAAAYAAAATSAASAAAASAAAASCRQELYYSFIHRASTSVNLKHPSSITGILPLFIKLGREN